MIEDNIIPYLVEKPDIDDVVVLSDENILLIKGENAYFCMLYDGSTSVKELNKQLVAIQENFNSRINVCPANLLKSIFEKNQTRFFLVKDIDINELLNRSEDGCTY